jgi:hypothetical protein
MDRLRFRSGGLVAEAITKDNHQQQEEEQQAVHVFFAKAVAIAENYHQQQEKKQQAAVGFFLTALPIHGWTPPFLKFAVHCTVCRNGFECD